MREFSEKVALSDLQESVEVLINEVKNYCFEGYSVLEVKTSSVKEVKENLNTTSSTKLYSAVIGAGLGVGFALVIGGNRIIYPVVGGAIGLLYDFWKSSKKESSSSKTSNERFDEQQSIVAYKQSIIKEIRSFDDKLKDKWEISMKMLINDYCTEIDKQDWDDSRKRQVKNSILVYNSLVVRDYVYTDPISDIESDSLVDFQQKINDCISNWRNDVVNILEKASKEQWNEKFSYIFNE